MKKALYSLSVLIFALTVQTSYAQEAADKREERKEKLNEKFNATDTDQDGQISKSEAEVAGLSRVVENFDKIDGNGDGLLSKGEFKTAFEERKKSRKS